MYYIISLIHTKKLDKYITLWRANNKGYCYSKENAGLYEEPKIGYHDSEDNIPITVDEADKLFMTLPYDGEEKLMIPNVKLVWDILGVKMNKNGLIKKEKPKEKPSSFSIAKSSRIIGISISTLHRRIKDGDILTQKMGKSPRITQEEIDKYMNNKKQ